MNLAQNGTYFWEIVFEFLRLRPKQKFCPQRCPLQVLEVDFPLCHFCQVAWNVDSAFFCLDIASITNFVWQVNVNPDVVFPQHNIVRAFFDWIVAFTV